MSDTTIIRTGYWSRATSTVRGEGNIGVKGCGGSRIDHPVDPVGKYPSHSFVESPEMPAVHTGRAVTDERG